MSLNTQNGNVDSLEFSFYKLATVDAHLSQLFVFVGAGSEMMDRNLVPVLSFFVLFFNKNSTMYILLCTGILKLQGVVLD